MAEKKTKTTTTCGVGLCMTMIGSAWKPIIIIIIFRISKGTNRFTTILREIEGINRQMLSKQLKKLEKSGILVRTSFAEIPPRVEYSITALGKSLLPVVQSMQGWGDRQQKATKTKVKKEAKPAPQQIGLFD